MATAGMLARMNPNVGDYWVIQEDGYVYLNPREVFRRKYSPINHSFEAMENHSNVCRHCSLGIEDHDSMQVTKLLRLEYSPQLDYECRYCLAIVKRGEGHVAGCPNV